MTAFGSLVRLELAAQARRARPFVVRTLVALTVLLALANTYASWFGGLTATGDHPISGMAQFAERFAITVLLVQYAAAVILTPHLVADCIVRDRESGALDLILASRLGDAEFLTARLASRLAGPASAVAVVLPMLVLTQLFGGIGWELLAVGTLSVGVTMVTLGGISAAISAHSQATPAALLTAMATCSLVGGFVGLLYLFVFRSGSHPGYGLLLCVVQLALTAAPYKHAIDGLRRPVFATAGDSFTAGRIAPFPTADAVRAGKPRPSVVDSIFEPNRRRPPVGDDPLFWKDRHFYAVRDTTRYNLPLGGVVIGGALLLALLMIGSCGVPVVYVVAPVAMAAGIVGFVGTPAIVFTHALGGVARERERDTLDGLRLTPDGAAAIRSAKWRAAVAAPSAYLGVCAVPLAAVGFYAPPLGLVASAVVVVDVLTIATVGVTVSAACRTMRRAYAVGGLLVLATLFAPVVTSEVFDATGAAWLVPYRDDCSVAVSPLWVGATLVQWLAANRTEASGWGIALHFALCLTLNAVLWPLCGWLIGRDGKR